METPPSRRSLGSSSSAAPAETLPPVMLPSSLAEERRTELEAEKNLKQRRAEDSGGQVTEPNGAYEDPHFSLGQITPWEVGKWFFHPWLRRFERK